MAAKYPGSEDYQTPITTLVADGLTSADLTPRKLRRYAALFIAVGVIYSLYLQNFLAAGAADAISSPHGFLFAVIKIIVLSGWPFAVASFIDGEWTSRDGARVAVAAFAASIVFWFHRYGIRCFAGSATLFIPFIVSAAIGHHLGALCHTWRARR